MPLIVYQTNNDHCPTIPCYASSSIPHVPLRLTPLHDRPLQKMASEVLIYSNKDGFSFPKLDNNNWAEWADNMERLFDSINCWEIITGDEQPPPGTYGDPVWESHDKRWRKTCALLHAGSTNSVKPYLKGLYAPHDMWDALKANCDSANTGMRREAIHQQFTSCNPTPGRPIVEWLEKLLTYRNRISGTPEAIHDSEFRIRLWNGLPKSFGVCVQFQQQRRDTSIHQVMDAIKEFERINALTTNPAGFALATSQDGASTGQYGGGSNNYRGGGGPGNYRGGGRGGSGAQRGNNRGGRGAPQPYDCTRRSDRSKWCTYHGLFGHYRSECNDARAHEAGSSYTPAPARQDQDRDQSRKRANGDTECTHCYRTGHTIDTCFAHQEA